MSTGFTIFGLTIHYYGIIIMIGAVAAAFVANRRAKGHGQDGELVWDMLPWLLIAGIIGARLWHVFTPPASMLIDGNTLIGSIHWTSFLSGVADSEFLEPSWEAPWHCTFTLRAKKVSLALGGYHRTRIGPGTGNWTLGELCQPGSLRTTFQPALGNLY